MTGDLVVAATVGTARRGLDLDRLPDELRPAGPADEPAVALLDAAALSAVARRCTPRPPYPADPSTAAIAPAETRPEIPDAVRQELVRMRKHEAVLVEAITAIERAGLRLPPDLVPVLLDDPRTPVRSAAAGPVGGAIGGLLTVLNPRWAAAGGPDPDDSRVWDDGTLLDRTRWLRARRRVDPDGARALLADGFTREPAASRVELLAALSVNLGPADQDLLLAAVGDRSRAVGMAALDLLTRIPQSPLRRDMQTLAARHLVVRRRLLRPPVITLTDPTPQEFAPWPAPDHDPWTTVLSRIDPVDWPTVFGADLLPLVGAPELRPLRPGFRRAAVTFRHADLAFVLVRQQLDVAADAGPTPVVDAGLWAVLAPDALTACFERLLADPRVRPGHLSPLLDALERPWPIGVSRRLGPWLATSGTVGIPAARPRWDAWAERTGLADCPEIAGLARQIIEHASGENASALVSRASPAVRILTLRAVLHGALPRPEGSR